MCADVELIPLGINIENFFHTQIQFIPKHNKFMNETDRNVLTPAGWF